MTQREEFEKFCDGFNLAISKSDADKYADRITQRMWETWQAAKATSFTMPDRMDYELHGDKVINDPFADGYNQCLNDVIAMNEEYANSTGSDGWIPVSERLPDSDDEVLVYPFPDNSYGIRLGTYHPYECKLKGKWTYEEERHSYYEQVEINNVTHWMPLPAAPEQTK